jgi:hypothetical protein
MATAYRTLALAALLLFSATAADAHPHVWLTFKSEMVYGPNGALAAVRHVWTFDEMFSTFATQGLDKNGDGKLSREELAELAEVNVTSLKEFDYFTVAKAGGKPVPFEPPTDYWLEHANSQLTLHFTLPVKAGAASPDLFRRLQLRGEGSGNARECAGGVQARGAALGRLQPRLARAVGVLFQRAHRGLRLRRPVRQSRHRALLRRCVDPPILLSDYCY